MSATIEQRLEAVEVELADLKSRLPAQTSKKDPWSTAGWAEGSEHYDAAMEAGRQYRASQTYEKELEARGGAGY